LDLNKFIADNHEDWQNFEKMLGTAETAGLDRFSHKQLRELGILYRKVCADLVHVRSATSNAELTEYLNSLVSRGYAGIYSARRFRLHALTEFFVRTFPRELRRRARYFALSAALLLGGIVFGFLAVSYDENSRYYLMPREHMHADPAQRAEKALEAEDQGGRIKSAGQSAAFSSFLFTHNIRVALLAFAAGIAFGLGTALVLGTNGVVLGAVAADYHQRGAALFFYSWVLPHGIMELTSIVIAGAAGLLLGRAVLWPGEYTTLDSLRIRGRSALILVLGTIPLFVVAGIIEGSLSQINPPAIPYWFKLLVAATTGAFLIMYLAAAGREVPKSTASPSPEGTGSPQPR
jgi:uncharacterized membrane protein SpoIIM required for sporulation